MFNIGRICSFSCKKLYVCSEERIKENMILNTAMKKIELLTFYIKTDARFFVVDTVLFHYCVYYKLTCISLYFSKNASFY